MSSSRNILALLVLTLPLRLVAAQDYSTPYYFTTIAGAISAGSSDGPAAEARFNSPYAVAADSAGNLYVCDRNNDTVRKVSVTGVVTTLAGLPQNSGVVDGSGPAARFGNMFGIAVDALGNVYVSDSNTIRKITPGGVVTTLAGSAQPGAFVDGTGSAARFSSPLGLAVGPAGDLFVADSGNGRIRKVTPAGVVSTLAGGNNSQVSADGHGTAANFSGLYGVAVDAAGMIYASERSGVRKISPTGDVTTLATRTSNPSASVNDPGADAYYLVRPRGIAVDATGNVFVADQVEFGAIRKITPAGAISNLAGDPKKAPDGSDGTGSAARFSVLEGMTIDPTGNLYVVDSNSNTIRKVTPSGVVSTLAGFPREKTVGYADGSGLSAIFSNPLDTAVDTAGNVYVVDTGNQVIRKISPTGVVTTVAGTAGQTGSADGTGAAARFNNPNGLTVDGSGNLYVSDKGNAALRKITSSAAVSTLATGVSGHGLCVDSAGNVFLADTKASVIRKITATGSVSIVVGPSFSQGTDLFTLPNDVAVDQAGNLFVTDSLLNIIRKVTVGGAVSTLAGQPNVSDINDGTGGAAWFGFPDNLAIDGAGNLYTTEDGHNVIRKITPAGVVSSLGGGLTGYQRQSGLGKDAYFETPRGISATASGVIYFIDGQTIRKGELAVAPVVTTQPQGISATNGGNVQLSVTASGAPAPTYQWFFNGNPFSGATSSTLSFSNARSTDAGDYTVVVTNPLGSVTSSKATLTVTASSSGGSSGGGSSGGGGGGGGGGGIPSLWFLLGLSLLVWGRRNAARTKGNARSER